MRVCLGYFDRVLRGDLLSGTAHHIVDVVLNAGQVRSNVHNLLFPDDGVRSCYCRAVVSVDQRQTVSVDLQLVEFCVDVLTTRVGQLAVTCQDPNVFGVQETWQQTVGARVENSVFFVVGVDNGQNSSYGGKRKRPGSVFRLNKRV